MGMWDVLSSGHQMTRKMSWQKMKSCGGYVQNEPCFSGSLWLSGSSAWCRMSIFRSLKKDHVPSYLSTFIRLRSKMQAATWHFFSACFHAVLCLSPWFRWISGTIQLVELDPTSPGFFGTWLASTYSFPSMPQHT